MIWNIYSLYDSKTQAYQMLWPAASNDAAIRVVAHQIANKPDHLLAKFPADFTLFAIGHWDDVTGKLSATPHKDAIASALEIKTWIPVSKTTPEQADSIEPLSAPATTEK